MNSCLYTYLNIKFCMYVCNMHIYVHTNTHMPMHVCLCMFTHIHTYVCINAYVMYMDVLLCMSASIDRYIQTII